MRVNILLLPVMLLGCTILGCAPRGRPVAQITTREGATYTVADPETSYISVCSQGAFDANKLLDHQGLRIFSREKRIAGQDEDKIPWAKIDSVDFGASSGDLGEFCPGMPWSVAADVRFTDGHTEHHDLEDTTDSGILGLSERGRIVIPVREIAHLSMVPDQRWPWSIEPEGPERQKSLDAVTLNITEWNGSTREMPNPTIGVSTSKQSGNNTLQLPFGPYVDGLPAVIAGARLEIPLRSLKSVDFDPPQAGKGLKANATFTDGHTEQIGVREGDFGGAEQSDATPFGDVKHMDVQTRPDSTKK